MAFKDEWKNNEIEVGGDFALLPEGEYEAIIDDSSVDLTKTPAKLSVTYKIVSGEFKNRKVWANYRLEGRGLGFLKKDMKTLGIDYSKVTSEQDIAKLMFGRIGQCVQVYINQKEWNGKTYNNAYLNAIAENSSEEIPF